MSFELDVPMVGEELLIPATVVDALPLIVTPGTSKTIKVALDNPVAQDISVLVEGEATEDGITVLPDPLPVALASGAAGVQTSVVIEVDAAYPSDRVSRILITGRLA